MSEDFDAPAWHLKNKAKWGPEFTARHERTIALLGKKVQVKLDAEVVVRGIFLGFGEGGDVELLCDDTFVHYCWPMLEVEEAERQESPPATAEGDRADDETQTERSGEIPGT